MKKLLILLPIVALSCAGPSDAEKKAQEESAKRIADSLSNAIMASMNEAMKETGTQKGGWYYSEEEDKMEGTKTYWAQATAKEQLQFSFPYDGGVTATIIIRKKGHKTDVMLQVSKGQFNSNFSDGQFIRVKFDDAKPEKYSCSSPSDGSSETLFINSVSKFISNAQKAKKVLIEAEFYDNGNHQMEFDISDLDWKHK